MKMNRVTILCLMLLGLAFLNCTKTENPIECPEQFTGELQETETKLVGEWDLVGLVSDTAVDLTNDFTDNPDVDMFAQYSDCGKDAIFKFDQNRLYSYETGTTVEGCSRTNTAGTWKLNSNELILLVACGSLSSNVSFNESNSRFSYTNTVDIQEVNGKVTKAQVTYTYEKVVDEA